MADQNAPLAPIAMADLDELLDPAADDQVFVEDAETGMMMRMKLGTSGGGTASRLEVGLSGDTNDLNPGAASWLRVTCSNAGSKITGIAGGVDGRRITISASNGLGNQWYFSQEDSGSVAANRIVFGDLLPGVLMADADAVVLIYDGDLERWTCESYYRAGIQHALIDKDLEDMTFSSAGAGSDASFGPSFGLFREAYLATGTTNTGTAGMHNGDLAAFAQFDTQPSQRLFVCEIVLGSDPSDGTNRFTTRIGFLDSITGEPSDGIYFRQVDDVNGGKWEAVCRGGGAETAADTGLAIAADFYGAFAFIAGALAVDFYYLDGAEVNPYRMKFACRITGANIPNGLGELFGYGASICRTDATAGAANREFYPYAPHLESNGG